MKKLIHLSIAAPLLALALGCGGPVEETEALGTSNYLEQELALGHACAVDVSGQVEGAAVTPDLSTAKCFATQAEVDGTTDDSDAAVAAGAAATQHRLVRFFIDRDFNGGTIVFRSSRQDFCQHFSLDISTIGSPFNNNISSLKNFNGCRTRLFDGFGFSGESKLFVGKVPWVFPSWNDRASSSKTH